MPDANDPDDAEHRALRELYAATPEDFLAVRAELAARLHADGNGSAAARVTRLRKPTTAAWIVNALVIDDPTVRTELGELGAALRSAQDELDAERLRELSGTRRTLVAGLCERAFELAARADPPAALRDDVRGTFEAAVADPDVAARLGRLQRPEQWSGFGFAASGQPQLTLVRGGRDQASDHDGNRRTSSHDASPRDPAAARREKVSARRALEAAQRAFDGADGEVDRAQAELGENQQRVSHLEVELAALRTDLEDAKGHTASLRSALVAAKQQRQRARRDLDRAQRRSE